MVMNNVLVLLQSLTNAMYTNAQVSTTLTNPIVDCSRGMILGISMYVHMSVLII